MSQFVPFGSAVDKIRNDAGNDDDFEPDENNNSYFAGLVDDEDDDVQVAFRLTGLVVVFLFVLVVLRYGCIFFIDAVVLCRYSRDQRSWHLRKTLSKCFPCWISEVSVEDDQTSHESAQQSETFATTSTDRRYERNSSDTDEEDIELSSIHVLRRLRPMQRKTLFRSLLKSRIVTDKDLRDWCQNKENRDSVPDQSDILCSESAHESVKNKNVVMPSMEVSNDSIINVQAGGRYLCPICIQELKVGENASSSEREVCNQHVFHLDCIVDWLSTGATLCPCCRRSILKRGILEESLRSQCLVWS